MANSSARQGIDGDHAELFALEHCRISRSTSAKYGLFLVVVMLESRFFRGSRLCAR
jgi:hypothetical protein